MAAPGVVGMSEVVQPTSAPSTSRWSGQPAMWSVIWVAASILFLVFIYLGMMGRAGR